MNIVIASLNEAKVKAVTTVYPNATIKPVSVPSGVAPQPIGDEETMLGAINRAKNAQKHHPHMTSIGLEGGVMFLRDELYLTNWGAMLTPEGTLFTGSGARIVLPSSFIEKIHAGVELSELMNDYTQRKDIRHHEGAIGIFTALHLNRANLFAQIITLLKGQQEYQELNEGFNNKR